MGQKRQSKAAQYTFRLDVDELKQIEMRTRPSKASPTKIDSA